MNKFPLACLILLLSSIATFAQAGGRYYFDNFDTRHGVQITIPETATTPLTGKKAEVRASSAPPLRGAAGAPQKTRPTAMTRRPALSSTAMASGVSLDGFTTGNPRIDALIVDSGARNGVDPVLLYAIMHRESAFKQRAISHKGASGLMQLMPGTAARFGVRNIFDPQQNIEGGTRYMRFLLDTFRGDVALALAGYNAGEGAVMKYGRRVPPYSETQEYVRRITQRYALMRNPLTARKAPVVTAGEVAAIEAEPPPPVYERQVFAVRLPDGKLRLVSQ